MTDTKHIIIAKNAPDKAKYTLQDMGCSIIEGAYLSDVQPPLAYHPDMQLARCGDVWVCAPQCFEYYKTVFDSLGFALVCGEASPGYNYPDDVPYNVAVVGSFAIHSTRHTDSRYLSCCPYTFIDVKQGYSKCSVCVVGDSAIITADAGIAKAAAVHGIDVLQVTAGGVALDGYDYGFIGGASGLTADGVLAFCGDVTLHPDYRQITAFCKKHSVQIVSLCPGNLVDVGTIVALG